LLAGRASRCKDSSSGTSEKSPAESEGDEEMGMDTKEEEEEEQDEEQEEEEQEEEQEEVEEEDEQAEEEEKETDFCVNDPDDEPRAERGSWLDGLSPESAAKFQRRFDDIKAQYEALCNFSRGEPQPQNKMADHF